MELGERLREAREAKNISLDSLQESTKIQKRYLAAIEEGNFDILPGKFYARAFIKEYANAVGIDPNDVLEEYKEDIPKTENEKDVQYTRIQRTRKENNTEKNPAIFSLMPTIIVVILVIGIILAAFLFYQQASSDEDESITQGEQNDNEVIITNPDDENGIEDNDESNEASEDTEDTPSEEEEEQPQAEFNLTEEGSGTVPVSTFELNNVGEELLLVMEVDGSSWVSITNEDEDVLYTDTLTEDDSPLELDLTGEERIEFNIGYTPNIQIMMNDVELEYAVDPNDRDHQRIWVDINGETE